MFCEILEQFLALSNFKITEMCIDYLKSNVNEGNNQIKLLIIHALMD